jgi:hypothetical protein
MDNGIFFSGPLDILSTAPFRFKTALFPLLATENLRPEIYNAARHISPRHAERDRDFAYLVAVYNISSFEMVDKTVCLLAAVKN